MEEREGVAGSLEREDRSGSVEAALLGHAEEPVSVQNQPAIEGHPAVVGTIDKAMQQRKTGAVGIDREDRAIAIVSTSTAVVGRSVERGTVRDQAAHRLRAVVVAAGEIMDNRVTGTVGPGREDCTVTPKGCHSVERGSIQEQTAVWVRSVWGSFIETMENRVAGPVDLDGKEGAVRVPTTVGTQPVERGPLRDQAVAPRPRTVVRPPGETMEKGELGLGKKRAGARSGYQQAHHQKKCMFFNNDSPPLFYLNVIWSYLAQNNEKEKAL